LYAFDTLIFSDVITPCALLDSTRLSGLSYAPLHYLKSDISQNFNMEDTIYVQYDDTIQVPVYINNNFSTTYNNIDYWMSNLGFDIEINYNPRALKYLGATSDFNFDDNTNLGRLTYNFFELDSM